MRIVCWQTILMKYTLLLSKIGENVANLLSAAVVIGILRINSNCCLLSSAYVLTNTAIIIDPDQTALLGAV